MPPEIIVLSTRNQGGLLSSTSELPKHPFKLDSYSSGMVCYEILVGHEPFSDCSNPNDIKRRIMNNERPVSPSEPSDCPPKLKALIEKCWSQDPTERPTLAAICGELRFLKCLLMTGESKKHRSFEKSLSDKTLASYQTPEKSLSDRSLGSLETPDSFRSSSNYSGHVSRGAVDEDASGNFWSAPQSGRSRIVLGRSPGSNSGHLESNDRARTSTHSLPTQPAHVSMRQPRPPEMSVTRNTKLVILKPRHCGG